ncbi:MAG: hypothetical protein Q8P67_19485, partial [archaeon]|nr:hypothetical protein [archaeon]
PEGINGALTLIGDAQTDSGIEPNAWVHHRIFLSSFLPEDTLVVDLQTDDLGTTEALAGTIYLRLSYQGVAQAPWDDFLATLGGIDERGQIIEDYCIDTALDIEFSCTIDGVSGNARINSRCILQVPSEELQVGVWFISLYYDRWYASHTDDLPNSVPGIDVLKGYTINVYKKEFNAPELCTLSTSSEVCNNCGGTLLSNPGIQQLSNVQPFVATDFANVEFNINYLVDTSPEGVYEFYSIVVDDSVTEILARNCTDSASDTCIFEHELHVLVSNTDNSVTDVFTGPINVLYYAPASLIFNNGGEEHLVQRWQYWNSNGDYDADLEDLGLSEDSNSTLFTLTACPDDRLSVALRVGTYYIAIQTTVENEYDFCARIDQTSHGVFVRQALTNPSFLPWGVFNAGDASVVTLWHDQVNTVTNPDGSFLSYYYRFRLDTIAEDQYVQVWLNDILNCPSNTNFPDSCSAVITDAVRIEMFRDDCQSWSCPSGDCVIDTEYGISTGFVPSGNTFNDYGLLTRYVLGNDGLALAGLDAGTYFVRVIAPDTTYFTFDVLLRTAFTDPDPLELVLNQDIILSPEIFSFIAQEATVWLYQYQIYTVDLLQQYPTGYTSGLIVTVGDVQCGQVHLSAKYGSPAGPPRKADISSENQASSFVDSCDASDDSPCNITIKRCDLGLNFDDTTATWYFSVYGHTQQQKYENTFRGVQTNEPTEPFNGPYNQPITNSIS